MRGPERRDYHPGRGSQKNHTFFLANFYFHKVVHGSIYLHASTIERGLDTTSHRNEHKTQSLLQCLGVRVHGVQEHGKGGFLSLLALLLPLLPTGLKTRPKFRHVGRLTCQLWETIQQVLRQIIAVLVHVAHQHPLFFPKKDLHNRKNHLFDWILCINELANVHLLN